MPFYKDYKSCSEGVWELTLGCLENPKSQLTVCPNHILTREGLSGLGFSHRGGGERASWVAMRLAMDILRGGWTLTVPSQLPYCHLSLY